ncbi:MAG: ribosome maturation factor RimM [Pseudomonadota bacterium]
MAAAEAWPEDAVEVARVADAWGVKGWIKVQPFSNEPQALLASRHWFLKPADGTGPLKAPVARGLPPLLHITAARRHGEAVVAAAQEVADRNAAEALRGARIFVSRASFPRTASDEYYWVDLIGLEVVNRQGERLGTVDGLIDNGPQTVLRVADAAGAEPVERLIPFVAAYVDDVNLGQRRITVDWGLDF